MNKKIIGIIIIILIACTAGLAGLYCYGRWSGTKNVVTNIVSKISSYKINKKIKENADKIEKDSKKENEDNIIEFSEEDIINIMHKMANTKIIADEKWGEIEITLERIENLQTIIRNSDFESKDKLLEILERWQKEDFSIADKDHNYLWEKLGGTVGRATGVLK